MIVLIFLDSSLPSKVVGDNFMEENILWKLNIIRYFYKKTHRYQILRNIFSEDLLRFISISFFFSFYLLFLRFFRVLFNFSGDILFIGITCKGYFKSWIDNPYFLYFRESFNGVFAFVFALFFISFYFDLVKFYRSFKSFLDFYFCIIETCDIWFILLRAKLCLVFIFYIYYLKNCTSFYLLSFLFIKSLQN